MAESCHTPAPDRTGRHCDKPKGHDGPHWTYGGNELTWTDQPSPVRASAQETPLERAQQRLRETLKNINQHLEPSWPPNGFSGQRVHDYAVAIETALSDLAAEARGRQQAEQARDEESRKLAIAEADYEHQLQTSYDLQSEWEKQQAHIIALTQALKDYGFHKPGCGQGSSPPICTCGLDAALTGAQATTKG